MLSLYIPVLSNSSLTEEFFKTLFLTKGYGIVDHVDIVHNLEKERHEAFIHFKEWFESDEANKFQENVKDRTIKTKIYYSDKNFIAVLENTNPNKIGENPKYMPVKREQMKELLAIKLAAASVKKESEKLEEKRTKKERRKLAKQEKRESKEKSNSDVNNIVSNSSQSITVH